MHDILISLWIRNENRYLNPHFRDLHRFFYFRICVISMGYRNVEIMSYKEIFVIWWFGSSAYSYWLIYIQMSAERLLGLLFHHTADLYLAILHLVTDFALGSRHNGFFSRQRPCLEWNKWLCIRTYVAEGKWPLFCRQYFPFHFF